VQTVDRLLSIDLTDQAAATTVREVSSSCNSGSDNQIRDQPGDGVAAAAFVEVDPTEIGQDLQSDALTDVQIDATNRETRRPS
jgi:hypothetical protein